MSMRFASVGTGTTPAFPTAVIFPPAITIVWSVFAAAPVPSITRTCSSAMVGDCTRIKSLMVGCGCGWAKQVAQLTTIRAISKRRMEQALQCFRNHAAYLQAWTHASDTQRMGSINERRCQGSEIWKQKSGTPKYTLDING